MSQLQCDGEDAWQDAFKFNGWGHSPRRFRWSRGGCNGNQTGTLWGAEIGDQTAIMDNGQVVACGSTATILADQALLERHGLVA